MHGSMCAACTRADLRSLRAESTSLVAGPKVFQTENPFCAVKTSVPIDTTPKYSTMYDQLDEFFLAVDGGFGPRC